MTSVWFTSTLERVFPSTGRRTSALQPLGLLRNARASVQLCLRNESTEAIKVAVDCDASSGVTCEVYVVGLVPMWHHDTGIEPEYLDGKGRIPGLVPDPILPNDAVIIGPRETRSFWVSLFVPDTAIVGEGTLRCTVRADGKRALERVLPFTVSDFVVEPLRGFPITHWFYGDAIADWYGAPPCSEEWWNQIRRYMGNLVAHYNTCMYVPIFTPPTDGVKRPSQLLRVGTDEEGSYTFDWSEVDRWIATAEQLGAEFFEWTHLFTQWGAANAIRIYQSNEDPDSLLWPPDTTATSPIYRRFLAAFLPEFHAYLERRNLLHRSFFHLSDEPGPKDLDQYRADRQMLRELAPWMRVMDAMSHVEFAREGLTDIPVASIGAARHFKEAGVPAWAYFCCGPRGRYLNRFLDTPLPRLRMAGRLLYALGAQGFLHWGYNYWYRSQTRQLVDPFVEQAGGAWPGLAYGDPFVVYPGPEGPLNSVRWEVWAEAMQDLAILRQLALPVDSPAVADIRDYCDFPVADESGPVSLITARL